MSVNESGASKIISFLFCIVFLIFSIKGCKVEYDKHQENLYGKVEKLGDNNE
jgi:hypothetical protein